MAWLNPTHARDWGLWSAVQRQIAGVVWRLQCCPGRRFDDSTTDKANPKPPLLPANRSSALRPLHNTLAVSVLLPRFRRCEKRPGVAYRSPSALRILASDAPLVPHVQQLTPHYEATLQPTAITRLRTLATTRQDPPSCSNVLASRSTRQRWRPPRRPPPLISCAPLLKIRTPLLVARAVLYASNQRSEAPMPPLCELLPLRPTRRA